MPSELSSAVNLAACRQRGQFAMAQGDVALAEQCFRQVLELAPDDLPARQFLAAQELGRDRADLAIGHLLAASRAHPDDAVTRHQLGAARMMAGDPAGAAANLREALARAPGLFLARLRLGVVLEQLGEGHAALVAYFGAIHAAQERGRWLGDDTTAPGLRQAVQHAMQYVNAGRRALFDGVIRPWRERYGAAEMRRVERGLAIYLGEQPAARPDPRQRPKFLFVPELPSQCYYPRARFPAFAALEAATETVRAELQAVLAGGEGLEDFLGAGSAQEAQTMLGGSGERPAAWDAYFFHRHGQRYEDHCARCPQTAALLDAMPLVCIAGHAPEALFSVLRPGTHILPHRGVTNTRLVTHLPLIIPPDCALRVGGETHVWREGECVTFDDTFEHEAWNRSAQTRVVLILDVWNPDLSEAERGAVADLVEAIGDFNRQCELPASPM